MKKFLLFVLMLLPMVAIADDSGKCGENVYYSYNSTTHTLTISGEGGMDYYGKKTVPWISYKNDIQSVIIESGVTRIDGFDHLSNLTSITIPNSVTGIGNYAFEESSNGKVINIISEILEPFNVQFAFSNAIILLTVPKDTKTLYKSKQGWNFMHIVEAGVSIVEDDNGIYYTLDGESAVVLMGVSTKGDVKIKESVEIDSKTYQVTAIDDGAFYSNGEITSVTIPNSVTSIGRGAFSGCSGLTSVTIPNSVESIGNQAFYNCSGLTSVKVPVTDYSVFCNNKVINLIRTSIGKPIQLIDNKGTEITEYIVPNDVTSIGECAFSGCSGLTSVTIPNSVESIGNQAFYNCSGLTSVTIPNSVTSIGNSAFDGCAALTSVTIPSSVTSIGNNAFGGCSGLTSIQVESGNQIYDSRNNCNAIIDDKNWLIVGCKNTIIPNSVTTIGISAFSRCSGLTSITIPNNVTSIGTTAFYGCTGLVYIILPSKLTSIGHRCFSGCKNLTDIYCNAKDVPSADDYTFYNTGNITLHVPSESVDSYKSTSPWSSLNVQINNNSQGTEKCSKPTISLSDGRFVFNCETPDVRYRWVISTPEGNQGYSNFGSQFTLNVFATKDGYLPSDVATYILSGLVGDVNNDGKVDVADHVKLSEIIMGQK